MDKLQNRLKEEKSPYLLQHKDNPVNWFAWGEEAFAAARSQGKPIFLSIGYSTCYWCHVMEKDSFEREDVAAVLNADFVSIKVDREERPDVDDLYMEAVVGLSGHGGWPMSVFLTPELKPFWGGTFFWRAQFVQILKALSDAWKNRATEVLGSAQEITAFLMKEKILEERAAEPVLLDKAFAKILPSYDQFHGGFGTAPKFPQPLVLGFLLRYYERSHAKQVIEIVSTTLEKMAHGGIFDHLGGGFHRYATDDKWLVPHFEKMLYDNALLSTIYCEAFQVTKNPLFRSVALECLNYMLRDLRGEHGEFFSAEDAGEVGKEGEFYLWSYNELEKLLSASELEVFVNTYQVTKHGNFEHGGNILTFNSKLDWSVKESAPELSRAVTVLREERNKRKRPLLDDKVLTSWNGLAITAFCRAFQAFGEVQFLEAAQKAEHFIRRELYIDGRLLRRYRDGEARFDAVLEDYAFYIEALIELYQSSFDEDYLKTACELQHKQDTLFWSERVGGYLNTTAKELIVQSPDFTDQAVPAGNSTAALNLEKLYGFYAEPELKRKAEIIYKKLAAMAERYALGLGKGLQALSLTIASLKELVISAADQDKAIQMLRALQSEFHPHYVFGVGKEVSGVPLISARGGGEDVVVYLCTDGVCDRPQVVKSVEELKLL